jgi:hypothetical protein
MAGVSSDLDVRRRRAAQNQSLFREVNERIEDLSGSSSFAGFICECLNTDCDEQVPLTIEEYEHVRSGSNQFVVLPGHHATEIEQVVESTDRYLVVSKLGVGAAVAAHLDPRKRAAPS